VNLYGFVGNAPLSAWDWLGLHWAEVVGTEMFAEGGRWRMVHFKEGRHDAGREAIVIHTMILRWEAEVNVICICAGNRAGRKESVTATRVLEAELDYHFDPHFITAGIAAPGINPVRAIGTVWEEVGNVIGEGIAEAIPAPPGFFPSNQKQARELANFLVISNRHSGPTKASDGTWKKGTDPCDKFN
jgi:hypothetical protein